jgi:hypothetical protein
MVAGSVTSEIFKNCGTRFTSSNSALRDSFEYRLEKSGCDAYEIEQNVVWSNANRVHP